MKFEGMCLISNVKTKNNTMYTDSALMNLDLDKIVPVSINFDSENIIGSAKVGMTSDFCNIILRADLDINNEHIDDIIGGGFKIAPSFRCQTLKTVDGISYPNDLELTSVSLVPVHSQDEYIPQISLPYVEELSEDEMNKYVLMFFDKENLESVKCITVNGCVPESMGDATVFACESVEEFLKEQCEKDILYTSDAMDDADCPLVDIDYIQECLEDRFADFVEYELRLNDEQHDQLLDYYNQNGLGFLIEQYCGVKSW